MLSRLLFRKRSRQESRRLYPTLVLLALGVLFTLFAIMVQPFSSVNMWLTDQLFTRKSPSPNIVIVGIDDDSLAEYGRWSEWPRSLHTEAINNLSEAGANVVGYDIIFADDSPDDQALSEAIENAGNVMLAVVGSQELSVIDSEITYDNILVPTTILEQASKSTGHANIIPDHDGTVRRMPLLIRDSTGQIYPSLNLAVLYGQFSMPLPVEYPLENGALFLIGREVPVDELSRLRINFSADDNSRPYLSYADVIDNNFDPAVVKDKMVLVGMTATGEIDTWGIPTSATKVPGVYVHAAAMDTILSQQFLTEMGTGTNVAILLGLAILTALLLPRLRLRWGGVLMGGLFAGYILASFRAFDNGYILSMLYPMVLLPTLYIGNVAALIIIEQADKRMIKDLFGRYVSPQVSKEILDMADSDQLKLGGEEREVSVLFADIREYTKLSETMSPEAIVDMLNTYLSIIIDRVLENGGMVNKFAGDNIMAVWNAPQSYSEHAGLAVKASLEAQQNIAQKRESDPALPQVQFGIGINTGMALAGNVGSAGRAEYTVIGDTVNLASRICSVTPGDEVWIGPETYRQVADNFEVEKLEPQSFKGKTERVAVYKVTRWLEDNQKD